MAGTFDMLDAACVLCLLSSTVGQKFRVIVVERYKVAGCASGKAGGFLARGWGDESPTQQLHHVSFDLHEQLAAELGIESYRKLETLSVRWLVAVRI